MKKIGFGKKIEIDWEDFDVVIGCVCMFMALGVTGILALIDSLRIGWYFPTALVVLGLVFFIIYFYEKNGI